MGIRKIGKSDTKRKEGRKKETELQLQSDSLFATKWTKSYTNYDYVINELKRCDGGNVFPPVSCFKLPVASCVLCRFPS